ncbi:MAG: hypothetical protein PHS41_09700, partial [Victivallaceae bacterium]|nr:hypothetical protein [Victivallaceae bacterium]
MMKIAAPRDIVANGQFRREAVVSGTDGREEPLFFSVPEEYASWVDTRSGDCFAAAMLYCAMREGEDLAVEAPLSEKFLFHVNNYVIPLLNEFEPKLKKIRLSATGVIRDSFGGKGVGTGFSGGIDSFCTIFDHY